MELLVDAWEEEKRAKEKIEELKTQFDMLLAVMHPEAYKKVKEQRELGLEIEREKEEIEEKYPKQDDFASVREVKKIIAELERREKEKKEDSSRNILDDDWVGGL